MAHGLLRISHAVQHVGQREVRIRDNVHFIACVCYGIAVPHHRLEHFVCPFQTPVAVGYHLGVLGGTARNLPVAHLFLSESGQTLSETIPVGTPEHSTSNIFVSNICFGAAHGLAFDDA